MIEEDSAGRRDFFVSFTHHDLPWARWLAWQLEDAGYRVVFQEWDFIPGANFVLEMQRASATADRTRQAVGRERFPGRQESVSLQHLRLGPTWGNGG